MTPRAGRQLTPDEHAGQRIEFGTSLDVGLRLRFVAKVGLAAGYLAYGRAFVEAVAHSDLRSMMNNEHAKLGDEAVKRLDVCAADYLRPPNKEPARWMRLGTESLGAGGWLALVLRD